VVINSLICNAPLKTLFGFEMVGCLPGMTLGICGGGVTVSGNKLDALRDTNEGSILGSGRGMDKSAHFVIKLRSRLSAHPAQDSSDLV
jgi:hypothetical protein